MAKDTAESIPREGVQRHSQGKFLSMVVFKGMPFLWKRWCCATGVKLGTCLAWIALWLHPPLKILVCLSLSRMVLLHGMRTGKFRLRTGKFRLGKFWFGLRVMLWFWLTKWVWLWIGSSFGRIPCSAFEGNFIWESKGSAQSGEDFSTGARFKCTSEG